MKFLKKGILLTLLYLILLMSANAIHLFADEIETQTQIIETEKSDSKDKLVKYNRIKSIKFDRKKMRMNTKDKRQINITVKYKKQKRTKNEPVVWSSSNPKVAKVNKKGIVTGKKKGTAIIKAYSSYNNKIFARCKVSVKQTKYIAFTFDDGPGVYTSKLLDNLNKYNSKATFFALGCQVKKYPSVLKDVYDSGMEIGTHTYHHYNLNTLSESEIIKEIKTSKKAIKDVIGVNPTAFRPPYGNYNSFVSKKAGLPMFYWSVDTRDWEHKDITYVYNTVLNTAGDGELVLLHDFHETTVKGFIKALPVLKKRGYELVTVSELYKLKHKKLVKGKMHYGPNIDK